MSNFEWVAAFVLSVVATGRITRLLVWDTYPPSMWLRSKWDNLTGIRDESGRLMRDENGDVVGPWVPLLHCGYCAGMYVAALVVLSGWLSDWHTAWWVITGTLTAAYLGPIVMAYDGED